MMKLADIQIYLVDPNFCFTCNPIMHKFLYEKGKVRVCQLHYDMLKALIEDANSKLSST